MIYTNTTTKTIGYIREDGDFAILATLNNNDGHTSSKQFEIIAEDLIHVLKHSTCINNIMALDDRQDAIDYLEGII